MHEAPSREPEAQDAPSGCRTGPTATPEVTRHHANILYRHTRYDREVFCHQAPGTGHHGSARSTESGSRQTQKGIETDERNTKKTPSLDRGRWASVLPVCRVPGAAARPPVPPTPGSYSEPAPGQPSPT